MTTIHIHHHQDLYRRGGYVYHIPSNTYTPFIKRLGVFVLQHRERDK